MYTPAKLHFRCMRTHDKLHFQCMRTHKLHFQCVHTYDKNEFSVYAYTGNVILFLGNPFFAKPKKYWHQSSRVTASIILNYVFLFKIMFLSIQLCSKISDVCIHWKSGKNRISGLCLLYTGKVKKIIRYYSKQNIRGLSIE